MERTKKITRKINDIEKRDDLFEDIPIWDYIRFELWSRLRRNDDDGNSGEEVNRHYTAVLRNTLKNTIFHNPLVLGSNDILFHGFSRRTTREDGLNWCLHCDPIIEAIDTSWCLLEDPNLYLSYQKSGVLHDTPARTPDIRYTDFFKLITPALRKLDIAESVADTFCLEPPTRIYDAINEISADFNTVIDEEKLTKSLLLSRKVEKLFYKKILARVEPSVVITVNRGQKLSLLESCNDLNIPTIDLQQGAIYGSHIGYSYSIKEPVPTMADYIFTFGEFWNELLNVPVPEKNIIPVGWPYFEQGLRNTSASTIRDTILILSQPNIGDTLADFAISLSEITSDYHVIFKPHPNTSALVFDKYPQLKDSTVSIAQDQSLYDLFSRSDVQIGRTSTALFEGVGFGLETYIVQGQNFDHTTKLLDLGFAKEVSEPVEAHEYIAKNKFCEETSSIEKIFRPNSLQNITEEIESIIDSEENIN